MNDIDTRLREAFDKVAACNCGNGIADGCCDNHAPSWNPCPDSQLLYDARNEIARLRSVCRVAAFALTELHEQMEPGSRMRSHTMGVICDLEQAGKEATDGQ